MSSKENPKISPKMGGAIQWFLPGLTSQHSTWPHCDSYNTLSALVSGLLNLLFSLPRTFSHSIHGCSLPLPSGLRNFLDLPCPKSIPITPLSTLFFFKHFSMSFNHYLGSYICVIIGCLSHFRVCSIRAGIFVCFVHCCIFRA